MENSDCGAAQDAIVSQVRGGKREKCTVGCVGCFCRQTGINRRTGLIHLNRTFAVANSGKVG